MNFAQPTAPSSIVERGAEWMSHARTNLYFRWFLPSGKTKSFDFLSINDFSFIPLCSKNCYSLFSWKREKIRKIAAWQSLKIDILYFAWHFTSWMYVCVWMYVQFLCLSFSLSSHDNMCWCRDKFNSNAALWLDGMRCIVILRALLVNYLWFRSSSSFRYFHCSSLAAAFIPSTAMEFSRIKLN